jgi:hypothetical protein
MAQMESCAAAAERAEAEGVLVERERVLGRAGIVRFKLGIGEGIATSS